jgi:hypothetical protein
VLGIRFFVLICAGLTSGCMSAPPLSEATGTEHSDILIKDVVQRVKCELSETFDQKVERPQFLWLASWTAHVDLTLQINDNAGISPSGSFTQFQRSALNKDAGPNSLPASKNFPFSLPLVTQSFSVSVGAGLSGQATRAETVSFTLALDELKMWRQRLNKMEAGLPLEKRTCNFGPSTGITGNLGLKEWVDSAFYPAEIRELEAGIHPAGGGAKPPSAKAPGGAKEKAVAVTPEQEYRQVVQWQELIKKIQEATSTFHGIITAASQTINTADAAIKSKIQDAKQYRYVLARYLQADYAKATSDIKYYQKSAEVCTSYDTNLTQAAKLAQSIIDLSPNKSLSPAAGEKYDELEKLMRTIDSGTYQKEFTACVNTLKKQADSATAISNALPAQVDPPIDSVLHSLTFAISYGANVSPSWTLLQWKGPGQNGSLLSATGTRTHTLNIALGPRTGAPAVSQDALRLINNQTIRSLAN